MDNTQQKRNFHKPLYRTSSRLEWEQKQEEWREWEIEQLYTDWQLSIEGQRKRLDKRY